MPFIAEMGSPENNRCLRLDTLVGLRWLSVGAQLAAVLITRFGLGVPLPVIACLATLALPVALNFLLKAKYPTSRRLLDPVAAWMLAFDIVQMGVLFYFTGGILNPFIFLLVAPVVVSATALGRNLTLMLATLAGLIALLLLDLHYPLPWLGAEPFELPLDYRLCVLMAIFASLSFMGSYSSTVAEEARKLATALAATELALTREQNLQRLDGLAAAAAHELGTPLATIALVTKELELELEPDSPIADDIHLLRTQSLRCRDILGKLSSLGNGFEGTLSRIALTHLLEDVAEPHREAGITITVSKEGVNDDEPVGSRNTSILYGLGNLVENAVDFARSEVEITARWAGDEVVVVVADDGPGFAPDVIDRMGEPYLTRKANRHSGKAETGGLGLGFFISKTLLERTGARLRVANRNSPQTGAVIIITWSREAFTTA